MEQKHNREKREKNEKEMQRMAKKHRFRIGVGTWPSTPRAHRGVGNPPTMLM